MAFVLRGKLVNEDKDAFRHVNDDVKIINVPIHEWLHKAMLWVLLCGVIMYINGMLIAHFAC